MSGYLQGQDMASGGGNAPAPAPAKPIATKALTIPSLLQMRGAALQSAS